jgi:ribonuclease G
VLVGIKPHGFISALSDTRQRFVSEEILINVAPMETRVALVDNGVLQEVYLERTRRRGMVGNIYSGKISRVLPGMQAAFVDIGLDKAGFIQMNDMTGSKVEGDPVIVQVIKDPLGSKGPRLTMQLSVSSRYLVYVPDSAHIGVSQRIDSEDEKERLRLLVSECAKEEKLPDSSGFIVRTVAEGASRDELLRDVRFLSRLWHDLQLRIQAAGGQGILHEDIPLYLRTMRDLVRPSVERVRIDSEKEYQRLLKFTEAYEPNARNLIEFYQGERPIFDLYGVEDEIEKALSSTVPLKSGGHLVIEQNEAMSTVDVNTGGYVGHRNLEETIYKTNLEAATAIARQLRLRNLGGIIIIDFIDMQGDEHRRQVLRILEKSLEKDRTKTRALEFSELGLVEMTRKRTRESLGRLMCEPCAHCQGKGSIKSAETVCYEIFREILRDASTYVASELRVLASQPVIDRLLDEDAASVADLERLTGKRIRFQMESAYAQNQYDIVLM